MKLRGHLAKSQSYLFSRDLEERFEAKIKMVVLVLDFGFVCVCVYVCVCLCVFFFFFFFGFRIFCNQRVSLSK